MWFFCDFIDAYGFIEADANLGGAVPFIGAVAAAEDSHIASLHGCETVALHLVGEAATDDGTGGICPSPIVDGGLYLKGEGALIAIVESHIYGIDILDIL